MKSNLNLILISLVCLLLTSSVAFVRVNASGSWVGNDNGEWDVATSKCNYLVSGVESAKTVLSSQMSYTSSDGYMSIQYNQDLDTDKNCQTGNYGGADWVQLVEDGKSSNNCFGAAIEVINTLWGWNDYFWQDGNSLCGAGQYNGIFNGGATWEIWAYTNSAYKINEVDYLVQGGGSGAEGTWFSEFPPANWYWLRSQICLCGGDNGEYATFSGNGNSQGTEYYGSSVPLYAWGAPIDKGTAEDSNMEYSCFYNQGTTQMYQYFNPNSHC